MRRYVGYFLNVLCLASVCVTNGHADVFEPGSYYFDNSKINYANVEFATFDTVNVMVNVYKLSAPAGSDGWWRLTLEEPVVCDLYSFIESDVDSGTFNEAVNDFIEHHTSRHTLMGMWREINPDTHPHRCDYVYCPILDDAQESDGYWRTQESYNATASGTLPVMHIKTQGSCPVTTKDYYIDATMWIDNCGSGDFQSLGSEENPLELSIKGRGNYTWRGFYKKPYKIKFAHKQSPLGLDKSKHFVLLPHADDLSGFLRDETGFELSRQVGMPYTTRQLPVELFLNDEYVGLYFLCENIRVEDGRVDIVEQSDNETNPYYVSGGWLLEVNGNDTRVYGMSQNNDVSKGWFYFTSHSPEKVSQVQIDYISRLISKVDSCVFVNNKNDTGWEQYLDMGTLTRFYIINEVMSNIESFCRSMFIYKDRGVAEKLMFGPVWDFGNSFTRAKTDDFIFNYESPFTFLWIEELLKFPRYQLSLKTLWKEFRDDGVLDKVVAHDRQFLDVIEIAKQYDKVRWPYYSDLWNGASDEFLNNILLKAAWLDEQWGYDSGIPTVTPNKEIKSVLYYNLQGMSSNVPFNGFNIKVTTYSDGTRSSEKIIK